MKRSIKIKPPCPAFGGVAPRIMKTDSLDFESIFVLNGRGDYKDGEICLFDMRVRL
jgi:hypothetical protein